MNRSPSSSVMHRETQCDANSTFDLSLCASHTYRLCAHPAYTLLDQHDKCVLFIEAKHRPCAVRMVVSPAWPEHAMCLTRGPIDTADIEPVEPERR